MNIPTEMPVPTTEDWIKIEKEFATRWNFPNNVAALVEVQWGPPNSGSVNHNYKGTFTVNLMGLVDGNYKFINIDVGQYGSNGDGNVFQRFKISRLFFNTELNILNQKSYQMHQIYICFLTVQ